ncbi:hypothetical protein CF328_g8531, partial [Tilletia controversa]
MSVAKARVDVTSGLTSGLAPATPLSPASSPLLAEAMSPSSRLALNPETFVYAALTAQRSFSAQASASATVASDIDETPTRFCCCPSVASATLAIDRVRAAWTASREELLTTSSPSAAPASPLTNRAAVTNRAAAIELALSRLRTVLMTMRSTPAYPVKTDAPCAASGSSSVYG